MSSATLNKLVAPATSAASVVGRDKGITLFVTSEYKMRQNEKHEAHLFQILSEAVACGESAEETAIRARNTWGRVKGRVPGVLDVPNVAFSDEGNVLLTWENDKHYLEIETLPDTAAVEFFYRDRETGFYEGFDWNAEAEVSFPESFCKWFGLFRVVR